MVATTIIDFFIPTLHGIEVNGVWFQQNAATCHTGHATIDLFRQIEMVILIGRQEAAI